MPSIKRLVNLKPIFYFNYVDNRHTICQTVNKQQPTNNSKRSLSHHTKLLIVWLNDMYILDTFNTFFLLSTATYKLRIY